MLYEIINPSDTYTFHSDDFAVAVAAILILGKNAYGFRSEDGSQSMLPFEGTAEFCRGIFGDSDEWLEKNALRVADCLGTVMSVRFSKRKAFDQAMDFLASEVARKNYRDFLHDTNRSSTNDIGRRAWSLAEDIRRVDQFWRVRRS